MTPQQQRQLEERNAVKAKIAARNSEFVTGKTKTVEYDGTVYVVRPITLAKAKDIAKKTGDDGLAYTIGIVSASTYLPEHDTPLFDASNEIIFNNQMPGGLLQLLKKACDDLVEEAGALGKSSGSTPSSSLGSDSPTISAAP